MFNYKSRNQLEICDFKAQFTNHLSPQNRWVILAKLIDWDSLAQIYSTNFSANKGAKSIDARIVIGALIIKHIEGKDDRGTIEVIKENPYMQYFIGLEAFSFDSVFDASLFVHIRKRLGKESFDKMNQIIIGQALSLSSNKSQQQLSPADSGVAMQVKSAQEVDLETADNAAVATKKADSEEKVETTVSEAIANSKTEVVLSNKGKLQLDATVCDAYIKYPTDLGLLNDARQQSEHIIDRLCQGLDLAKPRTYRQEGRKHWLNLSKSKKNSKKKIRAGIKKQLSYLKRNLKSIDTLLQNHPQALCHLTKAEYRYLLIISELYRQQQEMYDENKHTIAHRIVSIHQPHIRPIVIGKSGKNVEFGAKINLSLDNGYGRIDQLSFEAFNEGTYLKTQVENYKKLHHHYPDLLQVDAIYLTRENRKFLKDNKIRHIGKPLGRKSQVPISTQEKLKKKQEQNERNHIEGKFGQAKAAYGMNEIRAKRAETAESWIASIIFVMNILKLSKDILCLIQNSIKALEYRCFLFITQGKYYTTSSLFITQNYFFSRP